MTNSKLIAILIAIADLAVFYNSHNADETLGFALGLALLLSMILANELWARYGLGFGLLESLAKDSGNPEASAPAMALLGWVGLLILSYLTWF